MNQLTIINDQLSGAGNTRFAKMRLIVDMGGLMVKQFQRLAILIRLGKTTV